MLAVRALCSSEWLIPKLPGVRYNPEKYEVNPHRRMDLEHDRPGSTYVATGLPIQVSLTLLACINIMKTS
jgi:hypothetical protein